MHWVLAITCGSILLTMSMALVRAAMGPTVFDRVLALNMFGTKTVLMISVVSFLQGRSDFIDVALLYSLMNFIGMVALLRYVRSGGFVESLSAGTSSVNQGLERGETTASELSDGGER